MAVKAKKPLVFLYGYHSPLARADLTRRRRVRLMAEMADELLLQSASAIRWKRV